MLSLPLTACITSLSYIGAWLLLKCAVIKLEKPFQNYKQFRHPTNHQFVNGFKYIYWYSRLVFTIQDRCRVWRFTMRIFKPRGGKFYLTHKMYFTTYLQLKIKFFRIWPALCEAESHKAIIRPVCTDDMWRIFLEGLEGSKLVRGESEWVRQVSMEVLIAILLLVESSISLVKLWKSNISS